MAVRIPGRQPTAGLESLFLVESPGWMPGPLDSGARLAGIVTGVVEGWAGGTVGGALAGLSDTANLEIDLSAGVTQAADVSSRLAVAAGEATLLLDDHVSGSFGQIDASIANVGQGIGNAPGVSINIGPPPELGGGDPPGRGGI